MLVRFGPSAGIEAAIDAGSLPKGMNMADAYTLRIRSLNDAFRSTLEGGKTFITPGVSALGPEFSMMAIAAVQTFDTFSNNNDPYGEHDFGAVTVGNEKLFWKIDLYEDPDVKSANDPTAITRVITIMLPSDY